jgi:hypothetical protein
MERSTEPSLESIQSTIQALEGQLGDVRVAATELERRVEAEAAEYRPVQFRRPVAEGWEQDAWDAAELAAEGGVDGREVIAALGQHVELPEELSWIEFLVGVLKAAHGGR